MTVLSFYEGYTELSFGLFEDKLDSSEAKFFRFPYTYSNNLFENSFTREKFYRDVFGVAEKELNFEIGKSDLYASGFLSSPILPFEVKNSSSLYSNLSDDIIYVSSQMIALRKNFYSYMALTSDMGDMNFRMNLDIYHNIIYTDSRDIVLKDFLLRDIIRRSTFELPSGEYTITGDRFLEFDLNPALSYLLVFDILKNPGFFYLNFDKQNIYPHNTHLDSISLDYPSIGTLINIPGEVECLYETDLGTSQLFELKEDSIFMIPLSAESESRILIKSANQKYDQKVKGGDLGVIIDTRNKVHGTVFKEVYLNMVKQAMNRI